MPKKRPTAMANPVARRTASAVTTGVRSGASRAMSWEPVKPRAMPMNPPSRLRMDSIMQLVNSR